VFGQRSPPRMARSPRATARSMIRGGVLAELRARRCGDRHADGHQAVLGTAISRQSRRSMGRYLYDRGQRDGAAWTGTR
jgi:hypothetical protein